MEKELRDKNNILKKKKEEIEDLITEINNIKNTVKNEDVKNINKDIIKYIKKIKKEKRKYNGKNNKNNKSKKKEISKNSENIQVNFSDDEDND